MLLLPDLDVITGVSHRGSLADRAQPLRTKTPLGLIACSHSRSTSLQCSSRSLLLVLTGFLRPGFLDLCHILSHTNFFLNLFLNLLDRPCSFPPFLPICLHLSHTPPPSLLTTSASLPGAVLSTARMLLPIIVEALPLHLSRGGAF